MAWRHSNSISYCIIYSGKFPLMMCPVKFCILSSLIEVLSSTWYKHVVSCLILLKLRLYPVLCGNAWCFLVRFEICLLHLYFLNLKCRFRVTVMLCCKWYGGGAEWRYEFSSGRWNTNSLSECPVLQWSTWKGWIIDWKPLAFSSTIFTKRHNVMVSLRSAVDCMYIMICWLSADCNFAGVQSNFVD